MALRSVTQVAAGFLAGAVLVGTPTWAFASQSGDNPGSTSDSSSSMAKTMSDATSQHEMMGMMGMMSKLMVDPQMSKMMHSTMSGMGKMADMGDMSKGSKSAS